MIRIVNVLKRLQARYDVECGIGKWELFVRVEVHGARLDGRDDRSKVDAHDAGHESFVCHEASDDTRRAANVQHRALRRRLEERECRDDAILEYELVALAAVTAPRIVV